MICRKCCNGKHHKCKAIKLGSLSWCDCQHRIDGDVQHRVDPGPVPPVDRRKTEALYQSIMKRWSEASPSWLRKAMSDDNS